MVTKNKNQQRDYNLRRNYGITLKEYQEILHVQGGVCFICGSRSINLPLHVDHKHVKNEKKVKKDKKQVEVIRPNVRGLLCWACNTGLKKYFDDPARLRRAAEYLENLPARKVLDKE